MITLLLCDDSSCNPPPSSSLSLHFSILCLSIFLSLCVPTVHMHAQTHTTQTKHTHTQSKQCRHYTWTHGQRQIGKARWHSLFDCHLNLWGMAVDMFGYVGKQRRGDSFLLDQATVAGPCFIRALGSKQKKAAPKCNYLIRTMREATQSQI